MANERPAMSREQALEPVRREEELDTKAEQSSPENDLAALRDLAARIKAGTVRIKFIGQQPGEEGVEYDGNPKEPDSDQEEERKRKEPIETPPPPPKGEPPYRKL